MQDDPDKPQARPTSAAPEINSSPAPAAPPRVSARLFFPLAALWIAILHIASTFAPRLPLPALVALLAFLAIPLAAAGIYLSSIRQIRWLTAFSHTGLLATLLAGRTLRCALWTIWSVFASLFLIVELGAYQPVDWVALALLIPVFWLVFAACRKLSRAELRPYLATASPVTLACLLTPFLMLLLYVPIRQQLAGDPGWHSFGEAVAASKQSIPQDPATHLIAETSAWFSYLAALKSYIVSSIASQGHVLAFFIFALTQWVVFVSGCLVLSSFAIPLAEFRRIFAPPLDTDLPPPATRRRTVSVLSVATLSLVTSLALVRILDRWIAEDPRPSDGRAWVESQITIAVEWIEGAPRRPGTMAAIRELRIKYLSALDPLRDGLIQDIDSAFDLATSNVDDFLDWYYSLGGEYVRIAKMLAGQLESHIADALEEKLALNNAFAALGEDLANLSSLQAETLEAYNRDLDQLLATNRLHLLESQKFTVIPTPTLELRTPPQPEWITRVETRVALAATSGLSAGVVSFILVRPAFKAAVQSVVRILATKGGGRIASALGGAAVGGGAGSVVPGLGNVGGACVGFVVGLVAAVSVDKIILEIEEAVNREEFKNEILQSLNETRSYLKSMLLPPAENPIP